MLENIHITGAVVTRDRYSTPHHLARVHLGHTTEGLKPVENQDYGLWVPDCGTIIADGIGGNAGGAMASKTVVRAVVERAVSLGVRNMPADEAMDAVQDDVLPFADARLAVEKDKSGLLSAGSTLGAHLLARDHVITVGIGDTPAHHYNARTGVFRQITEEQHLFEVASRGTQLTNCLAGTKYNTPVPDKDGGYSLLPRLHPRHFYVGLNDVEDQVVATPIEKGDRYLLGSDGLHGDTLAQHIDLDTLQNELLAHGDAHTVALRMMYLPLKLWHAQHSVTLINGEKVPYTPKRDDMAVGTLFFNVIDS